MACACMDIGSRIVKLDCLLWYCPIISHKCLAFISCILIIHLAVLPSHYLVARSFTWRNSKQDLTKVKTYDHQHGAIHCEYVIEYGVDKHLCLIIGKPAGRSFVSGSNLVMSCL